MNFVGLSFGVLFSEVVVLGAKVGIAPQTIREVISSNRTGQGFVETNGYAEDLMPMLSDQVGALNGETMEEEVRKGL